MKEASAAENMKTVLQAVLPRLNEETKKRDALE